MMLIPLSNLGANLAHAQTAPDAGALQQQIQRDRQTQLPEQSASDKPNAPSSAKSTAGATLTVSGFQFTGNTLLTHEQLSAVVAGYLNRSLDFAQLQEAAAAVANSYRDAGWIVRTSLPEQDIRNGVVTIQIVEAAFGGVRVDSSEFAQDNNAWVSAFVEARQPTGHPLNSNALDRGLLIANDLPGVAVFGTLAPGRDLHSTDVALKLTKEALASGSIALNNTGSRSTGANQLTANVSLNNPYRLGDQLAVSAIHSQGINHLRLGYTLPAGSDGWRIGANASQMRYQLIEPEFDTVKGSSNYFGLEANYPIVRSRKRNLFVALNHDNKRFDNQANGATNTRYKINSLSATLYGNLFDAYGGGGSNFASLSLLNGRVNLDGSPNQASDASTTQTAGNYTKWQWTLSRQQVVTRNISVFAKYSGQGASKNLDSSEKFYLGGANGVRAYPSNEGSGSAGQILNLEVRVKLPKGFTLTGFHDSGSVTVNNDNDFVGAASPNDYSLKGHGLSLDWAPSADFNLNLTWARREGDNPNRTSTGNDQDGTLIRNRFWLSASMPF